MTDTARGSGGRVVWLALLCLSLVSLPLYTWAKARTVNSDDLAFLGYARDLCGSVYRVTDWCWCHSLYLLPDQLLFLPLSRLLPNPLHAYYLHAIALFLLQVASCAWLATRLITDRRDWLPFVSLQSLTLLFLVYGQHTFPQQALFWIGWHGGVLIPGLVYLGLAIDLSGARPPRPHLMVALSVLAFLSTLSDRLFLGQFAIPVGICWLVMAWRRRLPFPRAFLLLAVAIGSCAFAVLTQKRMAKFGLIRTPGLPPVTWEARLDGILTLAEILQQMCVLAPFCVLLLVVGLGVCFQHLYNSWRIGQSNETEGHDLAWDWIALFYPWCILGTLLAPVYAGLLRVYAHTRFFYPLVVPGSLLVITYWLRHSRQQGNRFALAPCCLLLCLTLLTVAQLPPVIRSFRKDRLDIATFGPAESLAKAIAAHGVRCGYAGFWEAKVLCVAHPGHPASQLTPDGSVFPWLTNLDYYFTDRRPELGRGIPRYEYLFLSRRQDISLGQHPFWTRFGPPAAVVECGLDTVLVYNRPSDVGFRNFLRLPCLIEAKRPLPVSSTHDGLRTYRPTGTPPSAAGVVRLELNIPRAFPLERPIPVAGHVLELSLDHGDEYEVTFLHQHVEVGKARLRSAGQGLSAGLNPFFLLIEDFVHDSTIDAVRVTPASGDGRFAVGHLFVYPDSRISPRERLTPSGREGKGIAKSGG
ncbi:MAG: hypothetical protein U0797_01165 [Gemmataceae bacterium]